MPIPLYLALPVSLYLALPVSLPSALPVSLYLDLPLYYPCNWICLYPCTFQSELKFPSRTDVLTLSISSNAQQIAIIFFVMDLAGRPPVG